MPALPMAGLPGCRLSVWVGPPLFCRPAGENSGLTPVMFPEPVTVPVGAVWNRLLLVVTFPA